MTTNEENMSNALTTLTRTLATKLGMGDGADLIGALKATAFKGQVSDAQMIALLVVANQYALNPWTKEIYAFPDKNNGIVPVVGVDGWSRIINSHPQFDGIEFEQDSESCTVIIYRKDRSHPIKVTEWMAECKRGTGPWQSHPRRMLRHKAMIQGARLAFGYGGIYDQDEAERIVEAGATTKHMGAADVVTPPAPVTHYDQAKFNGNFAKWAETIAIGRKTAADYINFASTRGEPFTEEQKARLLSVKKAPPTADVQDVQPKDPPATAADEGAPAVTYADLAGRLRNAANQDALNEAATLIGVVENPQHRAELTAIYNDAQAAFA